jgi:hypothetical protein
VLPTAFRRMIVQKQRKSESLPIANEKYPPMSAELLDPEDFHIKGYPLAKRLEINHTMLHFSCLQIFQGGEKLCKSVRPNWSPLEHSNYWTSSPSSGFSSQIPSTKLLLSSLAVPEVSIFLSVGSIRLRYQFVIRRVG